MKDTDKRPRHFADEILRLPPDQRAAALANVPAEHQPIVQHYVTDAIEKRRTFAVYKIISTRSRTERARILEEAPAEDRQAVREWVEKIFRNRQEAKERANVADSGDRNQKEVSG